MTADEIIRLAKDMRDAQKAWFKGHNQSDLDKSRRLERQLDNEIEAYMSGEVQMDLFCETEH